MGIITPAMPNVAAPRGRLGVYVALSLLAHGAAMTLWPVATPPAISSTVVTVHLQAPTESTPTTHTATGEPRRQPERPVPARRQATPEPATLPAIVPETTAAIAPPDAAATPPTLPLADIAEAKAPTGMAAATAPMPLDEVTTRVRARLAHDLQRHFSYPRLAVQRGWEGEVVLAMRVTANGSIEQIHLARSSGYALLDESALSTLRRIGVITDAADWLAGRSLELRLPVLYRLQQG